ncbi:MAG: DUF4446 family protein [Firmicutes bacterium]|nr:DUF4446 family protein [Bacillota bacterium]
MNQFFANHIAVFMILIILLLIFAILIVSYMIQKQLEMQKKFREASREGAAKPDEAADKVRIYQRAEGQKAAAPEEAGDHSNDFLYSDFAGGEGEMPEYTGLHHYAEEDELAAVRREVREEYEKYAASLALMNEQSKQISDYMHKDLGHRIDQAITKTKMVRYNAFEGLGGELSFIWVLLDSHNSGYLLHNIYNREGSSCMYARIIENGVSKTRLSAEESRVLDELIRS